MSDANDKTGPQQATPVAPQRPSPDNVKDVLHKTPEPYKVTRVVEGGRSAPLVQMVPVEKPGLKPK